MITEENRLKPSLFHKGQIPWNKGKHLSDEHKKNMSLARKGKPRSKEAIEKTRLSNTGKHRTEKTKEKTSLSLKGHPVSEETRRKISLAKKGKPGAMLGKHLSEERKTNLRIVNTGKRLCEETKKRISESMKGKPSWNKGKSLPLEMKEKIKISCNKPEFLLKQSINTSKRWQNLSVEERENRIRKSIGLNPSKGQLKLFEYFKSCFSDAELNKRVLTRSGKGIRFIDIAIPSFMLGIEYDGIYWHTQPGQIESDAKRDKELSEVGWEMIHIPGN